MNWQELLLIPWILVAWMFWRSDGLTGEEAASNSWGCIFMFIVALLCSAIYVSMNTGV